MGTGYCRPGPHGPTACGEVEGEAGACTCGCDAYYNSCSEQKLWYEAQQRQADEQAGRRRRWEDLP